MTALNKQALKPGLYAILFRNNWDGEGDTYETLASLDSNLIWHNHETGKELFEYEGDAVLKAWLLNDSTTTDALEAKDITLSARDYHFDQDAARIESLEKSLEAAEKRIAELEAREVAVKQFDDFQIVHYGATEDYAKGYIDCQNNYNKALAAAGIGVKGE
ncbi:hypothetical protein [Citrobacter freundii]|uniref:hypothetical protein n=1 Tax=Citrobacter freundii TaxID=546 RepID=UPI0015776014|nr:hypothetical protein [Citrobacter freundii]ELM6924772.1 hypothetical protein [Citrobacter freundii]ELQ7921662.1 hypothetical protein [Citrobacter freundii]MBJ8852729.1 hypothetical protein [Citrobacter freundii]MDH0752559.1 hypothetical protein [Citrobacter freundii]MDH1027824.1 hypothetical protein [Citrobacter freundii]